MKIHELFEDTYSAPDIGKLRALLEKDCAPFLSEIKYPLYRGLRKRSLARTEVMPSVYMMSTRSDRTPMNMPEEIQTIFDDFFEKEFGVRFRTSGAFATFNQELSAQYGAAYMIFPIGKYKMLSSNVVDDAYFDLLHATPDSPNPHIAKAFTEIGNKLNFISDDYAYRPAEIIPLVLEKYGKKWFSTDPVMMNKIARANNETEVIVSCAHYYAVNADVVSYSDLFGE